MTSAPLDHVRGHLAEAETLDPREHLPAADEVRSVVAIIASSRGGSSLLHELLSRWPGALSIGGEHTALYKLNEIQRGADGSDALDPTAVTGLDRLRRDLTMFMRVQERQPKTLSTDQRVAAFTRRLTLQWPQSDIALDDVRSAVQDGTGPGTDVITAFRDAVDLLRRRGRHIDAAYYDWPHPNRSEPAGPPTDAPSMEEPPFVVPSDWRAPTGAEVRSGTLVVKSSVDTYRLPLLRRLFPQSELHLVHLVRNPAASINGLVDGWLDRGFYSYDVFKDGELNIDGYRQLGPHAARWWNFDVPPGWERFRDAPLVDVAARQWAAAHEWALNGLATAGADSVTTVRFEDVLDQAARPATLARLGRTTGLTAEDDDVLPSVMATRPPAPGRWRARQGTIEPVLSRSDVAAVAAALGYVSGDDARWT